MSNNVDAIKASLTTFLQKHKKIDIVVALDGCVINSCNRVRVSEPRGVGCYVTSNRIGRHINIYEAY